MTEELIIIDTAAEAVELIKYIRNHDYVAYDTETTGLQKDTGIVGISVSAEVHKGYYIPLAWWNKETKQLDYCSEDLSHETINLLQLLCHKHLIMHNALFDVEKTLLNFNVDLMPALHTDTMVLAHLVDENRRVGLKDLAASIFGISEKKEQEEMSKSVHDNGGQYTKLNKEMYKADRDILARYGAKDTILTLKLFYHLIPQLFEQGLDKFFYEDECMPLLKTAIYQLNTVGLKVDVEELKALRVSLEEEVVMLEAKIKAEIYPYVKDKYPGTTPTNTFNIGSPQQLSWLLFSVLNNEFDKLTEGGRKMAKELMDKVPYSSADKRRFLHKLKLKGLPEHKYLKCDKTTLQAYEDIYPWVRLLLSYKKAEKILGTYVIGILDRLHYGVIYPGFRQTGTSGTRLSSNNPNFQNLPSGDKRIKNCIVARNNRIFVGADFEQLEPRIFTAQSQDVALLHAFANKQDPYSTLAMKVFNKTGYSVKKADDNFFGKKYPQLRQVGKEGFLAFPYGTTPFKFKETVKNKARIDLSIEECKDFRTNYFEEFSGVSNMISSAHEEVINTGVVYNMFGRPRRIPDAKFVKRLDWKNPLNLDYEHRTLLNLAMNFKVQGTAGSLVNRACIAFVRKSRELGLDANIVMQIHDEIIVECNESQSAQVADLLKESMINTVKLPGVELIADPKIGKRLSDLK